MSRPAFYRSYQTKEDIIVLYCREIFRNLLVTVRNCEGNTKWDRTHAFFQYFDEEYTFMEIMIKAQLTHLVYDEFCIHMSEFFRDQTNQYEVSKEHEKYLAQYISSGLFRVLIEWIRGGREESAEQMTDFIFEVTGK